MKFTRFDGNPIISPDLSIPWKARATYNPAAFLADGKVHIVYRAQANDGTSVLGYAVSTDGYHIDENIDSPIYVPRESWEQKTKENWNSGCEDPRITIIDDRLLMTYTAYDGVSPPRVALTSISLSDFLSRQWNWDAPKLISPPGVDDKDACIFKSKQDGYWAFHRLGNALWLDDLKDMQFPDVKYLTGGIIAQPRKDFWDNVKIGLGAPPIETEHGWLLLYHAVSDPGFKYKMGAMLLSYEDPHIILGRTNDPLFEPEEIYEIVGQVENAVFGSGAVVKDGTIFMYYGGADTVVGVATINLQELVSHLLA